MILIFEKRGQFGTLKWLNLLWSAPPTVIIITLIYRIDGANSVLATPLSFTAVLFRKSTATAQPHINNNNRMPKKYTVYY